MKSFDVYTKVGCPYCDSAKNLLTQKGFQYREHNVPSTATKEQIQQRIKNMGLNVAVNTVPQIFFMNEGKETYIGGFNDLQSKINSLS